MTLSSIIAIIATMLTTWLYCLTQLDFAPLRQEINEASSKKRPWLKALHLFNIDEAPTWRKILLKLLLSIFCIIAISYSFYTIFTNINADMHIFWKSVATAIVAFFAWGIIGIFSVLMIAPAEVLSCDLFGLWSTKFSERKNYKQVEATITAINGVILCFWVAIFIICLTSWTNDIFMLIGLSAMVTFIAGLCLFFVSAVIFKIAIIIFSCIYSYIKWLIK